MLMYSQPYQRNTGRLNVRLTRQNGAYLLTAENLVDAPELLYRLCAVLYVHSWNIQRADICTLENFQIQDKFIIKPIAANELVDDLKIEHMMDDFERLLFDRHSVLDFLKEKGHAIPRNGSGEGAVEFDPDVDRPRVIISGRDRPGFLLAQTMILAMMEVDVLEARINTEADGSVRNVFVTNPSDLRFRDPRFREKLSDGIRGVL
jgi:[protein-PII] uridylyltransferase